MRQVGGEMGGPGTAGMPAGQLDPALFHRMAVAHSIWIKGYPLGQRGDFSHLNLRGCALGARNLRGADLTGAKLAGLCLEQTDLAGARLDYADLSGCLLEQVNLAGASLIGAKLTGARIINFEAGSDRVFGSLTAAIFSHADLRQVTVRAILDGTDFSGADLSNADFRTCETSGSLVRFDRTKLQGADLSNAQWSGVSFVEAELVGTNLNRAILTEARFAGTKLVDLSARSAQFLCCEFRPDDCHGLDFTNSCFSSCGAPDFFAVLRDRQNRLQANLDGAEFDGTGNRPLGLQPAYQLRTGGVSYS